MRKEKRAASDPSPSPLWFVKALSTGGHSAHTFPRLQHYNKHPPLHLLTSLAGFWLETIVSWIF